MSGVTELGYVRFGVANLDEWRNFATSLLGLEAVDDPATGRVFLRADYWHHRISLEEHDCDDLIGAGLRVAGVEEFLALQRTLEKAGIPFEVGSDELASERRVLQLMSLNDPAGNPLEIFHGPLIEPHNPFLPGRRMHGRYVTDSGGVGHMILRHAGLDQAYAFYKLLGMRGGVEYKVPAPDGSVVEILFMHCNDRDHTVAFGLPGSKKINHLMLEVEKLDDVFLAHELVQASAYPVAIGLGKHANDHMFSFYFTSPSGFLIEIGYGGRAATHQSEYYARDIYGHEFTGDAERDGEQP